MNATKRLKLARPDDQKLGRPTIMDRALAQRHGASYVHLAAFAIDIDRVHAASGEQARLPFGWEVFLTEVRLLAFMDETEKDPCPLIEDICLSIMEAPTPRSRAAPPFGSQFPFAVYTGVQRGLLPGSLESCFREWKKPPTHLVDATTAMAEDRALLPRLIQHCFTTPVSPPLVDPVRHSLTALANLAVAEP